MRPFKATYKDRNGQPRESKKWYLDFVDHLEIRHKISVYTNQRETKSFADTLQNLITLRKSRQPLESRIYEWLESLPDRFITQFVSWGLIEPHRASLSKTLVDHLQDFQQSLLADGCTNAHAQQKHNRVKKILVNDCGYRSFGDIQASKVKLTIDQLRRTVRKKLDGELQDVDKGPASQQTKIHYTRDLKSFTAWALLDRRTTSDPLLLLKQDSTKKKSKSFKTQSRSFTRRALEPKEIGRLLQATLAAGERYGMSGYERQALYRLALETGLRAGEIRSLKANDLDLDQGIVRVVAKNTKNGEEAILPLRQDLCDILQSLTAHKHPEAPLFTLPDKLAEMLRKDLKAAQIDPEDTRAGRVDFHALRHTFGSLLAASGVHPKIAQDLMRHSDINLTMSRYSHTLLGQGAKAVESLPDFATLTQAKQIQTGTDGRDEICLDTSLDKICENQGISADFGEQIDDLGTEEKSSISAQNRVFSAKKGKANGRTRTDNRRFTKPGLYH